MKDTSKSTKIMRIFHKIAKKATIRRKKMWLHPRAQLQPKEAKIHLSPSTDKEPSSYTVTILEDAILSDLRSVAKGTRKFCLPSSEL